MDAQNQSGRTLPPNKCCANPLPENDIVLWTDKGLSVEMIDYNPNGILTAPIGAMFGYWKDQHTIRLFVQVDSPQGDRWLTGDPSIDPPKIITTQDAVDSIRVY